jgi:hypothetical protein
LQRSETNLHPGLAREPFVILLKYSTATDAATAQGTRAQAASSLNDIWGFEHA